MDYPILNIIHQYFPSINPLLTMINHSSRLLLTIINHYHPTSLRYSPQGKPIFILWMVANSFITLMFVETLQIMGYVPPFSTGASDFVHPAPGVAACAAAWSPPGSSARRGRCEACWCTWRGWHFTHDGSSRMVDWCEHWGFLLMVNGKPWSTWNLWFIASICLR